MSGSYTVSQSGSESRRWWRIAGALALAHIVLMLASFSLQKVAPLGSTSSTVVADHIQLSMSKGFAGGYLTVLSFLVFMIDAALITRLVRGRSMASQWWSSTASATAGLYVATTFVGLAALGGALYDGHRGASVSLVTTLVDVHWFAIFLATAALGAFTLALCCAAHCTRSLPRWVSYSGAVVGALCILTVPGARIGLTNLATVVWLIWFALFAIVSLRAPGSHVADETEPTSTEFVGVK
jgi:hypothetical protein